MLPLLAGCTYYFDTGLDRQLSRRVEERLNRDEGLPLEQVSETPPVSVEQALPKFKEGRARSGRTLPPVKPALSEAEGPVLSEAEGAFFKQPLQSSFYRRDGFIQFMTVKTQACFQTQGISRTQADRLNFIFSE